MTTDAAEEVRVVTEQKVHRGFALAGELYTNEACNVDDASKRTAVWYPAAPALKQNDRTYCLRCFPGAAG